MQLAPSPPSPSYSEKETIDLPEKEEKIFRRLLEVICHFGALRFWWLVSAFWAKNAMILALHWITSLDEFCENVNSYLLHTGEEMQGIGVIQRNPEQSKHLEIARMGVYDMWIDFVNLRSKKYVENSRIPTMVYVLASSLRTDGIILVRVLSSP